MSEVSVDVSEQVAHDGRHTRTHVLGRQAGEVPGEEEQRQRPSEHSGKGCFVLLGELK